MTYDYSKYEWQIGTEVIGKSKDIDVTCVGAIHNIIEHDGNIYIMQFVVVCFYLKN